MKQLQAGYILDGIEECLSTSYGKDKINGLINQLSYFDISVQEASSLDISNPQNVLFVANNYISRGLPTRTSLDIEQQLVEIFNLGTRNKVLSEIGSIQYDMDIEKTFLNKLYRALHIIEPRILLRDIQNLNIQTWENHLGSEFEEDFLYEKLPSIVNPFWPQLFEKQRELENILMFSTSSEDEIDKILTGGIVLFNQQMVDFSIEFPYQIHNQRGIILEIDGSQHEEKVQKTVDESRDNATEKAKWKRAIRITTREWDQIANKLKFFKELENEEYFKLLRLNYHKPLYLDKEGLNALQIALTPFAVARIQKTLITLLLGNQLDLTANEWNIIIVEQDVPCARLAVDDLTNMLNSLYKLAGEKHRVPAINLAVINTPEFENAVLSQNKKIDQNIQYDVALNISMLERTDIKPSKFEYDARIQIVIRSSHSPKTYREFLTSDIIKYHPLGYRDNDQFHQDDVQVHYLEKFVQDIFRKQSFRPGQVEIINRAIQGKSVIGLLPTGSGKSLTYQLSVLLQPGLTVIIDPIKSLMKDQYDGLLKNKIDCSVYINSSLTQKEKLLSIEKLNKARILFAFISPERLQDETFRKQLIETVEFNNNYFSYCVIDEAHCVSEWGHDFRTSYLRLGDNARKYCKTKSEIEIPFFALTATASYDVLADIQRELKILDDNAIIRLEKLDRPELQFVIKEVVADIDPTKGLEFSNMESLGLAKQSKMITTLSEIPKLHHNLINDENVIKDAKEASLNVISNKLNINNFFSLSGVDNSAGLVFCPHRNWHFGVTNNAINIASHIKGMSVGTFMGSSGEEDRDQENDETQTEYLRNNLSLLVATKAFGMGIDKPNIRFVTHFNHPSSIESYYQEAGRAGRDRKLAIGVILFNQQLVDTKMLKQQVDESGDLVEGIEEYKTTIDRDLLESFHRNNFKGIAKEKFLLAELLTEIKFPTIRVVNQLEDRIAVEFGIFLQLRTYTNKNKRLVLYLNPNFGSIYLDRDSLPFYAGDAANDETGKIANFIKKYIQDNIKPGLIVFDWLNQFTQNSKQDGIEKLLQDPTKPDEFIVIIPFVNNAKEQIAMYLQQNEFNVSEQLVNKSYGFCTGIDEFIENLQNNYKKENKFETLKLPSDLKPKLKNLFLQIREAQDTYKCIYRLSIIGVIDDYTVDYNSDTISAYISRKEEGYYTDELKNYLLQYNSIERVKERLERLPHYKGSTEIQKCLGFLIKFIYEEIAEQRKEAIHAMEEACKIGLQENGSARFKEFIDLYMNSKYARPEFLPTDTDKGLSEDYNVVIKYIDLVRTDRGGEINNLKHLRGAATVLLVQRPDNYVFMLLKAFSIFVLEKGNDEFIEEAKLEFYNAFEKLSESDNEDSLSIGKKIELFKSKLKGFDEELMLLVNDIEDIIYLNLHLKWLKNFNDNFIGDLL